MDDPPETTVTVLLIEDNPGDVRLVEEAIDETSGTLHVTRDGREALDFLHQRNEYADVPHPDVVLLDLNLPKVDGTQILGEVGDDPELASARVVVITSAREEHTDLGPGSLDEVEFLTKPTDPDEFMARVRSTVFD
ncbi:response regulator [Halomicrobium urmianum]|uniref:response regulator n=1 Tax=Halomicrobium urmianum TaxID=1586233 RepID=UPI001CD91BCE|nr:response regulator [Halomicrobium urmianum]